MTVEIALVLGVALVAIFLFATEKLRIDAVAARDTMHKHIAGSRDRLLAPRET